MAVMNLGDFVSHHRVVLPLGGGSLAEAAAELLDHVELTAIRDPDKLRRRVAEARIEDIVVIAGRAFVVHYRSDAVAALRVAIARSEERRVGKECQSTCRSRWSPYH